jgi:RimJ/RimL family protein N-acetyltransferase
MRALAHPVPPLTDGVVRLRPWREADVPAVVAAFADPLNHRFSWPFTSRYGEGDARRSLAEQEHARMRGAELAFALVEPDEESVLLGGASLYDVERSDGRAAVGYWLAPGARGRGVATHAVELLAGWAFGALGLQRLRITCDPSNHGSRRVAEAAGFTFERVLPAHLPYKGALRDTAFYTRAAE